MGSLWSFSPKQAAQLFSSRLCSPLKTRLNICFHLSEMEEGWYKRRKIYAGFLIPTAPDPLGSQHRGWAGLTSLQLCNVQIKVILILGAASFGFHLEKWGFSSLGGERVEGGEKTFFGLGLLCHHPLSTSPHRSPPPPAFFPRLDPQGLTLSKVGGLEVATWGAGLPFIMN